MNIDVVKAIKELLFEHNTVILPGLGGFISTPVASAVDYVQGAVQPPSRKLEFNTNLVIDDGVLVHHVQQSNVVTAQEAKIAIENYVAGINESLEAREIVDLPEIGRLYKDYEQKIRFMPDSTNFELNSFGLPTVKFNPIVRNKNTETTAPENPKSLPIFNKPTSVAKPQTTGISWAERVLPTLIILAAILLALSLFMWLKGCGDEPADVPQERVNVKPKVEVEKEIPENDDSGLTNIDDQNENTPSVGSDPTDEQPTDEQPKEEEKKIEAPPAAASIFIVIHSFGSWENAQKFARDLEKAGYIAVTKRKGGLHRVGVEVPTSRQAEIDNLIAVLGKKFKATPVAVDY
ncbi:MAG: SPOR domain-containing protein [Saprospiraceae bacterium]